MKVPDGIPNDVGVIGLNSMSRSVVLRLLDQGFKVTTMDSGESTTDALEENSTNIHLSVATDAFDFLVSLRHPRTIFVFGGEETPFNLVLQPLLPLLVEGDLVIDAGISFFSDTAKHAAQLAQQGIHFVSLGLAGGQQGTRHGAVVMAGGSLEALHKARPWLAALALPANDKSNVIYFESAAAAHFATMVHATIEFVLMQLLTETFVLLQHFLLLTDEELYDPQGSWHIGLLNGYLAEVAGSVAELEKQQTPWLPIKQGLEPCENNIVARWAIRSARELGVRIPTIEAAAGIGRVAEMEQQKSIWDLAFRRPLGPFVDDPESVLEGIYEAFQAAMIITYAQAAALLTAAPKIFGFQFQPHETLRAWKGCVRLRARLLEDIASAMQATPDLPGLLADDDLSERVMAGQEKLRHVVWRACELDLPVPSLMAALDYLDSSKTAWLPVNLIQVPRRRTTRPRTGQVV